MPGHFWSKVGRQADEYITRGVMFLCFYVFMFAYKRGKNPCMKGLTICTMIEIVQSGFLDGVLGFPVQNSTNSQIPGV